MPYPTKRLACLALLPLLLALSCFIWPIHQIVMMVDGAILGVALLDFLLIHRATRALSATLEVPNVWSLNRHETVNVLFRYPIKGRLRLRAALDLPPELKPKERELALRLRGPEIAEVTWKVKGHSRGRYTLVGCHVAVNSRLGFWDLHRHLKDAVTIQIYPDLRQISEYELLARTNRLSLLGIRQVRKAGGETEFESLRDFVTGDPLKVIDWKATARAGGNLVARQYTVSKAQNLVLMIDAGRMMASSGARDARYGSGLLDSAIDAALMLAHVAVSQGDRVGLLVYHKNVTRFLPAKGGKAQVNRIIHALHDVDAQFVESRHDLAFMHINRRCTKRSLIIHITNILDDVNAKQIQRYLHILSKRHLALLTLLRDPDCFELLQGPIQDTKSFYQAGAAAHLVNWRKAVLERVSNSGILTLDCAGPELTAKMISEYLMIKARNQL